MSYLIAEVLVADLVKAIKSASIFAGSKDVGRNYDYVRIERGHPDSLYLLAGDQYQVAAVCIDADVLPDNTDHPAIYVTTESLKAALTTPTLKPGRTKPTVQLRWEEGMGLALVRNDLGTDRVYLTTAYDTSPLPPAFQKPLPPIDWDCIIEVENPSRFAVGPELITKVARAAWNNTDAVIVESGGTPHSPITLRIGTYLVAVLAPKDGRNGNPTTTVPNDISTRRSWH